MEHLTTTAGSTLSSRHPPEQEHNVAMIEEQVNPEPKFTNLPPWR